MKTVVCTLNIGNFEPEITAITYPRFKALCHKWGAEFFEINEPKYNYPSITMEKFQVVDIWEQTKADYVWFFDADTLVSTDNPPWHELIGRDIVLFNGLDFSPLRWKLDKYALRCREWRRSACTWCVGSSSWNIPDLWQLPTEPWDELMANIFPLKAETDFYTEHEHKNCLIDDFLLTRNMNKFNLKAMTIIDIAKEFGMGNHFFHHQYLNDSADKLAGIKEAMKKI
jgi:hypothetical protein